jgi:hypothetical protein
MQIFSNSKKTHQVVEALNGDKTMISLEECDAGKFLTRVSEAVVTLPVHEALSEDQSFVLEDGPDPGTVRFVKCLNPVRWICERGMKLEMCTDPTSFRPELIAER